MKRCPICAEMVDDHLSVCPYCGEPMPGATPAGTSQSQPSQPETPQPKQPTPKAPGADSGEMRFCPVCGERIGAHLALCPICFEPTGFDAQKAAANPIVDHQPATSEAVTETAQKPERKLIFDSEPEPETKPQMEPEPEPERRYEPKPEPQYEPEPEPQRNQEAEYNRQWPPEDSYGSSAPPKGANPLKWLLIALIALLAIGLGVLGYFLLRGDKDGEEPPVDPEETVDNINQLLSKDLLMHRIDSVEENLPEEAYALNAYPDAEHPCLYYVLNDKLMVYQAETDKTESVKVPTTSDDEIVLDALTDSTDTDYLFIDMGDKNGNYTYSYKMNTLTESFERIEEEQPEEVTVQEQTVPKAKTTTAKKSVKNNQDYYEEEDDYYNYPPSPRNRMNRYDRSRPRREFRSEEEREEFHRRRMERMERMRREGRPPREFRSDEERIRAREHMERMRREGRQPGDYPPPPSRNGNGFHLEPVDPGQSSSGSGIRLEKVDRIPNQY